MKKWRVLCGLKQDKLPPSFVSRWGGAPDLLDELEEIGHDVPNSGDKFIDLNVWIKSAPLTRKELAVAREFIANMIC